MARLDKITLIEVCLAAIALLVGVFVALPALKKAKQRMLMLTCFERAGNLAESFQLYANDNDATLPFAFPWNEKRKAFDILRPAPYPAAWLMGRDEQDVKQDLSSWVNSTLPFARDDKNFFCPATEIIHLPNFEYRMTRPLPAAMTYTFNGLLHRYPLAKIPDKPAAILAWEGLGNISLNGFATSNPAMMCSAFEKCIFGVDGVERVGMFIPLGDMRVHLNRFTAVFVDGHAAKEMPAATGDKLVPFGSLDSRGIPQTWFCGKLYPPIFRPDIDATAPGTAIERSDFLNFAPPDS